MSRYRQHFIRIDKAYEYAGKDDVIPVCGSPFFLGCKRMAENRARTMIEKNHEGVVITDEIGYDANARVSSGAHPSVSQT